MPLGVQFLPSLTRICQDRGFYNQNLERNDNENVTLGFVTFREVLAHSGSISTEMFPKHVTTLTLVCNCQGLSK